MNITSLHLTLSLSDAFIGNGWEELPGYIGIPGLYNNEHEVMLYLKPHIAVHAADVEAESIRFRLAEDSSCPLPVDGFQWAVSIKVSEGGVEAEII